MEFSGHTEIPFLAKKRNEFSPAIWLKTLLGHRIHLPFLQTQMIGLKSWPKILAEKDYVTMSAAVWI